MFHRQIQRAVFGRRGSEQRVWNSGGIMHPVEPERLRAGGGRGWRRLADINVVAIDASDISGERGSRGFLVSAGPIGVDGHSAAISSRRIVRESGVGQILGGGPVIEVLEYGAAIVSGIAVVSGGIGVECENGSWVFTGWRPYGQSSPLARIGGVGVDRAGIDVQRFV